MPSLRLPGIDLDRLASGALGQGVVAGLLVGEAAAREDHAPARQLGAPVREDALDLGLHGCRPAEPEGVEMMQAEGQHVVRMLGEDAPPDVEHAVEIAVDPARQRLDVGGLARGRALGVLAGFGERLGRPLYVGLVVGQHVEVAAQHMAQRELRIGLERRAEMTGGIGAVFQVGKRCAIEGIDGGARVGRQREAVQVLAHDVPLLALPITLPAQDRASAGH